jgi:hypothetical protein
MGLLSEGDRHKNRNHLRPFASTVVELEWNFSATETVTSQPTVLSAGMALTAPLGRFTCKCARQLSVIST